MAEQVREAEGFVQSLSLLGLSIQLTGFLLMNTGIFDSGKKNSMCVYTTQQASHVSAFELAVIFDAL